MPLLQKMISIISLTACMLPFSPTLLSLDFLFSRTNSPMAKTTTIMALSNGNIPRDSSLTSPYNPQCLLRNSFPLLHIYPFFLSQPSFSVSFLHVAIFKRLLLLLLMGDVNHRCWANNKPKHVHNTITEKRERETGSAKKGGLTWRCCCCCLFQYTADVRQAQTYLGRCLYISHFRLPSLCISRRRVISARSYRSSTSDDENAREEDDARMFTKAYLPKP